MSTLTLLGHRESGAWNLHGRAPADDDAGSRPIAPTMATVGSQVEWSVRGARLERATQLAILDNHELVRVDVAEEEQQGHPSVAAHERGVDIDPNGAQTLVVAARVR